MNVNPFEFNSMENHNFLENPLFFRKLNVIQQKDAHFWGNSFFCTKSWFHLEPKNRKPETLYRIKCDVGASKNASQAFSTKRLSSHFLFYQISAFRFFSPSNKLVFNPPFSPTVDLDSQKKEIIPYPRCGFGACLRCERAF